LIRPRSRFLARCFLALLFVVCPFSVFSQGSNIDYSKFRHDNANHSRLPCLLCHRRETDAPRPAMPGAANHAPCAGCHAKEFANTGHPICTVCHTDVQAGTVKPFPRLSSFGMRFDHARHQNLGRLSCASCHRPLRGGVALSIPAGFNAHTNCFACHTSRAQSNGRDISSCGTCHRMERYVRASQTARAFRVGFSHAKHDRTEGLSCNECHRVQATRVSAPQPLNHHAAPRAFSCMSCHNGKRAFGGDDFSVCKRCHTGARWQF
jgi:c(7)-type cytochrome triheme protein